MALKENSKGRPVNSTNKNMSEKKFSLLAVIGSYSISFLLFLILPLLLDTLVGVINVASYTPSEPISVHLITRVLEESIGFLKILWIWFLGTFVVGFIITYLASRSVLLSKVFLGLISGAVIIFSILLYWVLEESFAEPSLLFLALVLSSWIIAGASVPILLSNIWGRTENLLSDKKFWLAEILLLIIWFLIMFLITLPQIAKSVKNFSIAKSQIQKIYSDPTFPVYKPTYLPPSVGELRFEEVFDSVDSVEYVRSYYYRSTKFGFFKIVETKPKARKSNGQYLQEDLNELRARQPLFTDNEFYKYNPEVITINGNPALIYPEHILGDKVFLVLQLYVEGVRIRISVPYGFESEPLSKEELIKIAESLKRKN
jgi:hypothetical protein